MNKQELTKLFTRLGARNPEQWAKSQLEEGVPQLARFLFLRQAWNLLVGSDDRTWIRTQAATDSSVPGGAIAPALKRLLEKDVCEEDLTTVVRVMQWRLLSAFCYLLDDPGNLEDEVKDIAWRLFEVNKNGEPIAVIAGLHESVLDTEPSGSEMRPCCNTQTSN
ncbi:MAG: hypothetical protein ACLQAH_01275 [Limisphaerales bacterium]